MTTEILHRTFAVEVKAAEGERSVRVIASTNAIDSYGDIVDQTWKLDRYKANPVVLWNHNRSGGLFGGGSPEDTLPIGFAKDVAVVGGKLEATLVFVDEKASPLAERVYQGFLQGSIRAVSVGFRPNDVKAEKINGKEIYRLSNNDLYEISATPIPANPEAVAKAADSDRALLRAIASASGGHGENMDLEEMKAQLEAERAKVVELESAAKAAAEAHTKALFDLAAAGEVAICKALGANEGEAASQAIARVLSERDSAVAKVKSLEDAAIVAEVDGLVGKKIAPSERDVMLKLARADVAMFREAAAARPDMTLLATESVLGTDKSAPKALAQDANGAELASAIFSR